MVLPFPIDIGKKWSVDSKTYLILKRYPYYDYRATTNFMINYEIISKNEIITTPIGKFHNCVLVRGIEILNLSVTVKSGQSILIYCQKNGMLKELDLLKALELRKQIQIYLEQQR